LSRNFGIELEVLLLSFYNYPYKLSNEEREIANHTNITDFIQFIEQNFHEKRKDLIEISLYALIFVYMKKNRT
jgi:hypothetical protein